MLEIGAKKWINDGTDQERSGFGLKWQKSSSFLKEKTFILQIIWELPVLRSHATALCLYAAVDLVHFQTYVLLGEKNPLGFGFSSTVSQYVSYLDCQKQELFWIKVNLLS